jgi:hypothetical protein
VGLVLLGVAVAAKRRNGARVTAPAGASTKARVG